MSDDNTSDETEKHIRETEALFVFNHKGREWISISVIDFDFDFDFDNQRNT